MKQAYTSPKLELRRFAAEDIVCSSPYVSVTNEPQKNHTGDLPVVPFGALNSDNQ